MIPHSPRRGDDTPKSKKRKHVNDIESPTTAKGDIATAEVKDYLPLKSLKTI